MTPEEIKDARDQLLERGPLWADRAAAHVSDGLNDSQMLLDVSQGILDAARRRMGDDRESDKKSLKGAAKLTKLAIKCAGASVAISRDLSGLGPPKPRLGGLPPERAVARTISGHEFTLTEGCRYRAVRRGPDAGGTWSVSIQNLTMGGPPYFEPTGLQVPTGDEATAILDAFNDVPDQELGRVW